MSGLSFRAFGVPAFSVLFAGQFIAQSALWFQTLSISFLVVSRTGSASALALVTVATFAPTLLCAPLAARAIIRWSARNVAIGSGVAGGVIALVLGGIVAVPDPSIVAIYAALTLSGAIAVFTRVAAQALVYPFVGPDLLQNGVTLSSLYSSAARSVGPGLAGIALSTAGPVVCQMIAAGGAFAAGLSLLGTRERHQTALAEDGAASTRKNSRLTRRVVLILVVNGVVAFAALNMAVVVTSAVTLSFRGDADALGLAHALNAIGAVVGGLLMTRLVRVTAASVIPACIVLGAALLLAGLMPTLVLFLVVSPLLGAGLGVYQAITTTAVQTESPPEALPIAISWLTMSTFGMVPLGSLAAGAVIDMASAQVVLIIGAGVCVIAGVVVAIALRRPEGNHLV